MNNFVLKLILSQNLFLCLCLSLSLLLLFFLFTPLSSRSMNDYGDWEIMGTLTKIMAGGRGGWGW